ncbi:MAG: ribonuclease E inhibitor RraB [Acinetobacter sp.]
MTRDYQEFPDDDNGNVLWQMYEDGTDLDEPHEIEFSLVFPDQEKTEKAALYLLQQEQKISFFQDDAVEPNDWVITVYVTTEPTYEDIVELEQWLGAIAEQFDGEYDGWGCTSYILEFDDEEDLDDEGFDDGHEKHDLQTK